MRTRFLSGMGGFSWTVHQPPKKKCCGHRPGKLREEERRSIDRTDARESVGGGSGQRNSRIGKRRRGREPIGCGDVSTDRERHCGRSEPGAAPDHGEEPEGGDEFTKDLSTSSSG